MTLLASRLALVLPLVLAGCATVVHDIPASYVPGNQPESIVFGHLVVHLSGPGGPEPLPFFANMTHIAMTVQNRTTNQAYEIHCDESGFDVHFCVALPPGEYTLERVAFNQMEASPTGHFSVHDGKCAYIGTLRYSPGGVTDSVVASVLLNRSMILGQWSVDDEHDEAIAAFHDKFPHVDRPVEASLIVIGT